MTKTMRLNKMAAVLLCLFMAFAMILPITTHAATLPAPTIVMTVNLKDGIELDWEKVDNADGYYIDKKENNGTFYRVTTVHSKDITSYLDSQVTNTNKYTYRIKAYRSNATSSYSEKKTTYRIESTTVTAKNQTKGIKVTWEKVPGATGYKVYRKELDGEYNLLSTKVGEDNTSFVNTSPQTGKVYSYLVKPYIKPVTANYYNHADNSVMLARLTKIQNVSAELLENQKIKVSWTPTPGVEGYIISQKNNTTGKATNFIITNGEASTKTVNPTSFGDFSYTVRSYTGSFKSEFSNKAYVTKEEQPQIPTGPTGVFDLNSEEVKAFLVDAIRNNEEDVNVKNMNISIDLTNGQHILSDFQDDFFYEYAKDSFCVSNMDFQQENGKLTSIHINYTEPIEQRNAMRAEIDAVIADYTSQVRDIEDETEKVGELSRLIWSHYYDDFTCLVAPHGNDAYGCLVNGYASRFGAAAAFQACMKELGYVGGYYLSGADIYSKNLIGEEWKYTNIAWNQSRKKNAYLLTSVTESNRNYGKAAWNTAQYTPVSLFSEEPSLAGDTANAAYFAEQVRAGNTTFTLPDKMYYNYRRGTSSFITVMKHEFPEIAFLVSNQSISWNDNQATVTVTYLENDAEVRAEMLNNYDAECEKITARAQTFDNDVDKIIFVNNYLRKTTVYKEYQDGVRLPRSHDAYGCLVNGECVCEGYATAFHAIMKRLGIKDTFIQSYNHIWNLVEVNGAQKHVDVTNNSMNDYLMSETHEANTPNGTTRLSTYTYVFYPSLSMQSEETFYILSNLQNKANYIEMGSLNFCIDERAKDFDTKWYETTLRNIYPVEMRDVDSMEFETNGDEVRGIWVTYKERSPEEEVAFDAIIQGMVDKAQQKTTKSEKIASVMNSIYGFRGSFALSGEEDVFTATINKAGSYLAKARLCGYVLEKLGIQYNMFQDRNVYYYVKTVDGSDIRYSSPNLSGYINLEAVVSYYELKYHRVFDFRSEDGENAYLSRARQ